LIGRRSFLKSVAAGALAAPFVLRGTARAADRVVRIGFVSPQTGPIAAFGEADGFVLDGVRKALADGIAIAGKTHPVEILVRDSQSSSSRAAEVANDLITSKCDLVLASSTSDTTNPVADQCEANEVPCLTTDTPWQAHFFGRRGDPAKGFDWTYHFFWGIEDIAGVFTSMWAAIETDKVIGGVWSNDPDGNAVGDPERGVPAAAVAKGFTYVDTGRFQPGSQDFSAQIARLKDIKADIVTGVFNPPDFSTFWTQAAQQGFRPKIVTPAKALLFPSVVESIGPRAANLSTEVWWSPTYPYKSGLTGQSSAEFGKAYEAASQKPWTQPMGFKHAVLEVAIDALKRTADIDDRGAIRDAIAATDYQSIVGRVSFKNGPVRNIGKTPLTGGQWRPNGDRFDLVVVDNESAPELPLGGRMEALPG
jgi:branched-chain amino acid transport system substrate-binding protein